MLFNSLGFLAFFAVVWLVYWRLPHRGQNRWLLAASLFFYGYWNRWLLLLLLVSASIDYFCAIAIENASEERGRRRFLTLSIVSNLVILGFFKYANFFVDSAVDLLDALGFQANRPTLEILLPVGISFYTFQAMSYSVDVYRRQMRTCRHYLDYLLYISFFPQLVAGPIERATRLLPQVTTPRGPLRLGQRLEGVKLCILGYVQKVAIADVLAPTVDRAFADPGSREGLALLLALYAFAFQIYCDFAGYSNIARGTARLLGFDLMRNFWQPYLSTNITEFWRRWHISLSSWLRDYLYIPLGGNRRGPRRTYVNLLTTMLLGGLWHGAAWTFVVWGGLHGAYLAAHKAFFRGGGGRLRAAAGLVGTFHLVCLAWVFFRAESFGNAWAYLGGLLRLGGTLGWPEVEVCLYVALALGLDLLIQRRGPRRLTMLFSRNWAVETVALALLVALVVVVGENHVVPFVYFQF